MGEDRMQSAQMLLDPDLVTQVYQAYAAQLGRDRNAKIKDVLNQEPFFSLMQQGLFSEQDIEVAVFQKIYAEEESADIQQMIAQFYNKFDELHEQSLTQALAKSPNKVMIKNEVKYRIPERWTKKFLQNAPLESFTSKMLSAWRFFKADSLRLEYSIGAW